MSNRLFDRRLLLLLAGAAVLAVAVAIFARDSGTERLDSWETDYSPTRMERSYSLSDVRDAIRMNVTVYDEGGNPAYLGWSGGSEEMEAFAEAVAGAVPAEGEPDESFADLIVFYFDDGGTLAASYSRQRGLLSLEGILYRPAGDITTIIMEGEERYQ